VAGPGFINLRLSSAFLIEHTERLLSDPSLGVPQTAAPQTIVIDYSSPNIAKQMHVGHIRSTILGAAIAKLLRAVGHTVIGDNHVGDWGTQFGLLIVGMRTFGSEGALDDRPIEELERIYRLASARAKEDTGFAEEARMELAKLQSGDAQNLEMWRRFVATTKTALMRVYARLDITFEQWLGESSYNDMLPGVVSLLREKGLARESEGAVCVFFQELVGGPPELQNFKEPLIVQKRDGAFLYATSDIATMFYRRDTLKATRSLYVVDARQGHHFRQVFALAGMLGIATQLEHIGFGSILGQDGKPLKTRDGGTVTLESVLDEAEKRALARIEEEGLEVAEGELETVARAVGIGAVKYADLRQNRTTDYIFDWDKLISFRGNSGPYLQYAGARIRAVFRKAGLEPSSRPDARIQLEAKEERVLSGTLLRFGEVVALAGESSQPHLLCEHLYALARDFSGFYEACPILSAEPATRSARLALTWLVGQQLERGLGLLGIDPVERM
jgi:arginyl-tRNA synthetase